MPRLTGSQTGTPQSDLFAGDIQIVDLTARARKRGILNATIDGLAGDDSIQGLVTLKSTADVSSVTALGIESSNITDSGLDDDSFTATGTAEGSKRATGYGVYTGSINGGAGDDAFSLSGIAKSADKMRGVGVGFATIDGGSFNDRISILGSAIGTSISHTLATAYGTSGAVVRGGSGKDTLEIEATARAFAVRNTFKATAIGTKGGWVLGDGDDDTIRITANSVAVDDARAQGASNARVFGGDGFDNIAIEAISQGPSSSLSMGINAGAVVFGGDSTDVIGIKASAESEKARAFGVRASSVFGGDGNDAMFITAEASGATDVKAYGIFKSEEISGGNGDDRMIISATTTAQNSDIAQGLFKSSVFGGEGNDQIIVTSTTQGIYGRGGIGAFSSTISGGGGNDSIRVRAEGRSRFDIQDSLIFGGDGDDKIDVGIGSGTIRGGAGIDVAVLDYFNAETMKITAIDGGIQVSGSQAKTGIDASTTPILANWSQNIFEVESFQVGAGAYTAETLVSTFSA